MQIDRRQSLRSLRWLVLFAAMIGGGLLVLHLLPTDLWASLLAEIQAIQRDLYHQLGTAMRMIRAEGAVAAWSLILLSFLYGVFHAAGPGHGKIVISTYILTQESQLRRGLLLSVIASFCQGVTAILAVAVTVGVLSLSLRQAQSAAVQLETFSYGLVVLVGLTLVVSRMRQIIHHLRFRPQPAQPGGHQTLTGPGFNNVSSYMACGHTPVPTAQDLDRPLSWRGLAGVIASIGLRPCSGAILVLLVAYSMDLPWAGVGAVMAMSLGTAITVSLLATLSVYARRASLRLAAHLPSAASRIGLAVDFASLAGGVAILFVGSLLLHAAWVLPAHPLR